MSEGGLPVLHQVRVFEALEVSLCSWTLVSGCSVVGLRLLWVFLLRCRVCVAWLNFEKSFDVQTLSSFCRPRQARIRPDFLSNDVQYIAHPPLLCQKNPCVQPCADATGQGLRGSQPTVRVSNQLYVSLRDEQLDQCGESVDKQAWSIEWSDGC